MMKRLLALTLLALAPVAQALEVQVWDPELRTPLGYGETSGGRLTVRLLEDYDGPVVVLFAQSDEEKARGLFPGLRSRYTGALRGGQLTLQVPPASGERSNTPTTLQKFTAGLKLGLVLQGAGKSLTLPGLKTPAPKAPEPKGADPKAAEAKAEAKAADPPRAPAR